MPRKPKRKPIPAKPPILTTLEDLPPPKPGTKAYLQARVNELEKLLIDSEKIVSSQETARVNYKSENGRLQEELDELRESLDKQTRYVEDLDQVSKKAFEMVGRFVVFSNFNLVFDEL